MDVKKKIVIPAGSWSRGGELPEAARWQQKQLHWGHNGRDVGSAPYPIPAADDAMHTNVSIAVDEGRYYLRGDLYIPVLRGTGPFPGIIEITPYGAQTLAPLGRLYASRGYLFLAIDCRGRYRSQGEWEPLTHDRADGQAVISWLATHGYCNGRIGTRGHSYAGYNQLMAAIDAPPALQAMVVGVAPGDPFSNVPFQGGAYDLNDLFWLLDMTGRVCLGTNESPEPAELGGDGDTSSRRDENEEGEEPKDSPEEQEHDRLLDEALNARPFNEIDIRLGIYHPIFREWLKHWQWDDFWHKRAILPQIHKIKAPTLFISGWWDGNGKGATSFFRALKQGRDEPSNKLRLLMGPWDHHLQAPDCDDLPERDQVAIERGAARNTLNDELAWFDHHLLDIPFGASNQASVQLFITGINRWCEFASWPVPQRQTTALYLNLDGRSKSLISKPPYYGSRCSYYFDPSDPTPFAPQEIDGERLPFDNAPLQKSRTDMILCDGPVLQESWAIIGPVQAVLYASADVPDFDLTAALYDVYPDGRSIYLSDGILRGRFAEKGFAEPRLIAIGSIREFIIDLWHLGHVLAVGHLLRLQIASAAYLRFDVNPCTGGDLASESRSCPATITLYGGGNYPSRVEYDLIPSAEYEGRKTR